jgi:hypothetical protein
MPQENESILEEAQRLTTESRNYQYGPWDEDAGKTCNIINLLCPLTNTDEPRMTPEIFTFAMIMLKLVRETYKSKRDNRVDAAGYLKLLDDLYTPVIRSMEDGDKPEAVPV